jgi:hypothetical protein
VKRRFWLKRLISMMADDSGSSLYSIDTPLIHGWSSACAALKRSVGTTFSRWRIKSLATDEGAIRQHGHCQRSVTSSAAAGEQREHTFFGDVGPVRVGEVKRARSDLQVHRLEPVLVLCERGEAAQPACHNAK